MLFPILYIGSRFYYKTAPVQPMDMDFISGIKEIEAETYDETPPKNNIERFWAWLVSALCIRRASSLNLTAVLRIADVKRTSLLLAGLLLCRNSLSRLFVGMLPYPPLRLCITFVLRHLLVCRLTVRSGLRPPHSPPTQHIYIHLHILLLSRVDSLIPCFFFFSILLSF